MANSFLTLAFLCSRQYEALAAQSRRTIDLYPDLPASHWGLGWAELEMRHYTSAIAELELAVQCSGGATLFRALLAEAHAVAGNRPESQRILQALLDNEAGEYVSPYALGRVQAALGKIDDAFSSLDMGWRERAAWMPFLKVDPRMDVLRNDARFSRLLKRINYPTQGTLQ